MKNLISHSFVRYIVVGCANTLIGLGVIYLAKWQWRAGDGVANAFGYAVGFIASFFLNRNWTFQFEGRSSATFVKFALVVMVSYAVNLVVVLGCIDYLGLNSYLAQALGTVPYALLSYLGCRFIVFPARSLAVGSP